MLFYTYNICQNIPYYGYVSVVFPRETGTCCSNDASAFCIFDVLSTNNNEETFLRVNLKGMFLPYYMYRDVCIMFKTLTQLCVALLGRINCVFLYKQTLFI